MVGSDYQNIFFSTNNNNNNNKQKQKSKIKFIIQRLWQNSNPQSHACVYCSELLLFHYYQSKCNDKNGTLTGSEYNGIIVKSEGRINI